MFNTQGLTSMNVGDIGLLFGIMVKFTQSSEEEWMMFLRGYPIKNTASFEFAIYVGICVADLNQSKPERINEMWKIGCNFLNNPVNNETNRMIYNYLENVIPQNKPSYLILSFVGTYIMGENRRWNSNKGGFLHNKWFGLYTKGSDKKYLRFPPIFFQLLKKLRGIVHVQSNEQTPQPSGEDTQGNVENDVDFEEYGNLMNDVGETFKKFSEMLNDNIEEERDKGPGVPYPIEPSNATGLGDMGPEDHILGNEQNDEPLDQRRRDNYVRLQRSDRHKRRPQSQPYERHHRQHHRHHRHHNNRLPVYSQDGILIDPRFMNVNSDPHYGPNLDFFPPQRINEGNGKFSTGGELRPREIGGGCLLL